jgi:hypothetical protein
VLRTDPTGVQLALVSVLGYICGLSDVLVRNVQFRMATSAGLQAEEHAGSNPDPLLAAASTEATAAAAATAAITSVWSQHAVSMCSSGEAYVRLQAAAPDGGLLATHGSSLATICSRSVGQVRLWHTGGLLQAALAAGPGSAQQVQLFGLLCSLLKHSSTLPQPVWPG